MKKNKLLLTLLLFGSSLSVASCGETSSTPNGPTSSESSSTTSKDPVHSGEDVKIYAKASYEEKAEILGQLEAYALEHNLTGITLYEDGGYTMYNTRIQKGTETYIPNYGFGILSEGNITSELSASAEPVASFRKYYHTYEADDPGTINALNDKGSVVPNLFDYIASSYYGTKLNANKDGYEWYPVLAKDFPEALDADSDGFATTWKIQLKTGEDGLVYNSLSSKHSKWSNKAVTLDDYVNTFKVLLTQSNGLSRGAELAGKTGASGIKGASKYFNASSNGFNAEVWEDVGIKADTKDNSLTFTLNGPCNAFYAMYYLNSTLYEPLPAEFITDIGGIENYGNWARDLSSSPLDNILALGPYMLEDWTTDQRIVFKKNPLWVQRNEEENKNLYRIEGVHVNILPASKSDTEAAFKEFINGKLDATGIPSTQLAQYKDDPRTVVTNAGTTTKLNVNSCTQETWNSLFGLNGTISQISSESKAWSCKPIMANSNFLKGVNASINRLEYATKRGKNPSQDYFGSGYLIDPEKSITYNSTSQHQANMLDRSPETYGYSAEGAKMLFKQAVEEEVAAGHYVLGTKEKPTVISLEMAWQAESNATYYGEDLVSYITSCFNDDSVCGGRIKLEFTHWYSAEWTDVYYEKMMVGQFDFGFGGIEGNPLDPLNFFEVLKSDNSSTFTLNWGTDTNTVSKDLYYDGQYWSFDALWTAADHGAYVKDGALQSMVTLRNDKFTASLNSNGDLVATLPIEVPALCKDLVTIDSLDLYTYYVVDGQVVGYVDLQETDIVVSDDLTSITITFSKDEIGSISTYDSAGNLVPTAKANSELFSLLGNVGFALVDVEYTTVIQRFIYNGALSTNVMVNLD